MKLLPRNWLLPINQYCLSQFKQKAITCLLLFLTIGTVKGQIANYVNNGGFESLYTCSVNAVERTAKNWMCVDSSKFCAFVYHKCTSNVPNTGVGYQNPRSGDGFIRLQLYYTNPSPPANFSRSNIKNRLKANLIPGKTYCAKMYVNLENVSQYAIDGFGLYFGDNTIDTINYNSRLPLTFLTPQVSNPNGNIIMDTLNWVPITGTFTATGNEKYLIVANFKSEAATNTASTGIALSGYPFSEYFIDDISCIQLDLPPFAGRDTFFIPGDSIYLGRPSDVGIDEDCMWYKLPNTTTAVDTVAGFWLKPTTTCTYVVKQEICGVVKWDTIILYQSAIGINELDFYSNNIKLYPQPAQDVLNIKFNFTSGDEFTKCTLYNDLGQFIREEELSFKNNIGIVNLKGLSNGIYIVTMTNRNNESVTKKLVITN